MTWRRPSGYRNHSARVWSSHRSVFLEFFTSAFPVNRVVCRRSRFNPQYSTLLSEKCSSNYTEGLPFPEGTIIKSSRNLMATVFAWWLSMSVVPFISCIHIHIHTRVDAISPRGTNWALPSRQAGFIDNNTGGYGSVWTEQGSCRWKTVHGKPGEG